MPFLAGTVRLILFDVAVELGEGELLWEGLEATESDFEEGLGTVRFSECLENTVRH